MEDMGKSGIGKICLGKVLYILQLKVARKYFQVHKTWTGDKNVSWDLAVLSLSRSYTSIYSL